MTPGLLVDGPLASRRAAVEADHLGVGPDLVDEHQLRRIKARLTGLPALAGGGHVGPVLLGRVQFFLKVILWRL
jgi:hypothetical protein